MTDTHDTVIQMVAGVARCPADAVTAESRLAEDLMIKSANRIELSVLLEDAFDVTISVFEVLKTKTVGDVVGLVEAKRAARVTG